MKSSKVFLGFLMILSCLGIGLYFFLSMPAKVTHTKKQATSALTHDIIVLTNNLDGKTNEVPNLRSVDQYRVHYIVAEQSTDTEVDTKSPADWYHQLQPVKDPTDANLVKEKIEKLAQKGHIALERITAILTPADPTLIEVAAELRKHFNLKGQKPTDLNTFEILPTTALENEKPYYMVETIVQDSKIVFFQAMQVVAHLGWRGDKNGFTTYIDIEDKTKTKQILKEKTEQWMLKNHYSNGGGTFYFSKTQENDYVLVHGVPRAEHTQQQIWDIALEAQPTTKPKSYKVIFEFYLPSIPEVENDKKTKAFLSPKKHRGELETLTSLEKGSYAWKTLYPVHYIATKEGKKQPGILEGDRLTLVIEHEDHALLQTILQDMVKKLQASEDLWPIDKKAYYICQKDTTWQKVDVSLTSKIWKFWQNTNTGQEPVKDA